MVVAAARKGGVVLVFFIVVRDPFAGAEIILPTAISK